MTAHSIAARAASSDVTWRRALLRAAGLPEELARAIAASDAHDLNSLLGGCDADASVPGMRTHLAGCPTCHEEYESLRALVTTPKGDELHA